MVLVPVSDLCLEVEHLKSVCSTVKCLDSLVHNRAQQSLRTGEDGDPETRYPLPSLGVLDMQLKFDRGDRFLQNFSYK